MDPIYPKAPAQKKGWPSKILQRPDRWIGEEVWDAEISLTARTEKIG